jgi:Mrp family chromosome partitioning ATPase
VLEVVGNLHLLPSVRAVKNPASLLGSEVVSDLMAELRRYFDFMVVSTSPIIESADVNILLDHVDGVVLVVRSGVTRREQVAASIDRIGESRFIGNVLLDA